MSKKKCPDELRERATRMAFDARQDPDTSRGAITRVTEQLGINREALRTWVRQAKINGGNRPGTTTDDATRSTELEKEVRELHRANSILKSASASFRGGARATHTGDLQRHRHSQGRARGRADLPHTARRWCGDFPVDLLTQRDPDRRRHPVSETENSPRRSAECTRPTTASTGLARFIGLRHGKGYRSANAGSNGSCVPRHYAGCVQAGHR